MKGLSLLLTGGTGSFGHAFTRTVLKSDIKRLIIYSRDEKKQHDMRQELDDDRLEFLLGDVRDLPRLRRAFEQDLDAVIHAAALKQIPATERNPDECIFTNILGALNVKNAAIDTGVKKVLALSTDKSSSPETIYGACKQVAEKVFIQGNSYVGKGRETRFSCTRYGNVIGSRGSVVEVWKQQRETGKITMTDPSMTRFWMTIEQAVELVLKALQKMKGGEVFIPILPSMRLGDLAEALAPDCVQEITGIRPSEKEHESLLSSTEARHSVRHDSLYIIYPEHNFWGQTGEGEPLPEGFSYSSDTNERFLTVEELRGMV